MELTVGAVLEGKVKSITNFGAFVSLPENKTGIVHISEVANAYVSDIHEHLTEGQDVKVMVIGTDNGKINLSIKRLEPRPEGRNNFHGPRREGGSFQQHHNNYNGERSGDRGDRYERNDRGDRGERSFGDRGERSFGDRQGAPRQGGYHNDRGNFRQGGNQGGFRRDRQAPQQAAAPKSADQLFEEKLKAFMSESDSKISSIKQYSDHRTKGNRRRP